MKVKKVEYRPFSDGYKSREQVLAEAQDEARQLLEKSHKDLARVEQEAYEQGFAQGEQAGVKMGMAQAQPSVEGVSKLFEELNNMLLRTLESMEPEIIRLVRLVAERVMQTVLAQDHEVIVRVVRAALAEADRRWEVTVRVNPTEYETLKYYEADFARIQQASNVKLVADPRIEAGNCRVESPEGFVDSSLKRALDQLFTFEE